MYVELFAVATLSRCGPLLCATEALYGERAVVTTVILVVAEDCWVSECSRLASSHFFKVYFQAILCSVCSGDNLLTDW